MSANKKLIEYQDMMDKYESKLNAAKIQAAKDMKKELHIKIAKPMRKITATLFIGKKKQFYFRVQAKNRKTICQSEGYITLQSALKTVKLLQGGNDWEIKDETK